MLNRENSSPCRCPSGWHNIVIGEKGEKKGKTMIQGGTDRYFCLMCTCAVTQITGGPVDTVDIYV